MGIRISRRWTVVVHRVLDNWLPPVLRDSTWFMYLPMRLAFGRNTRDFMTFKNDVFGYNPDEFGDLYRRVSDSGAVRETDLNEPCVERILRATKHKQVLEVGAGRGYLAGRLSEQTEVTACDIVLSPLALKRYPQVTWVEGDVERLPFDDHSFDTVVCTHTLEHVQNLPQAVRELRRVARKQLIIVVPRQRPYKYHFDLHTHFFPYEWSLRGAFGYQPNVVIENLHDWYYEESITESP